MVVYIREEEEKYKRKKKGYLSLIESVTGVLTLEPYAMVDRCTQ